MEEEGAEASEKTSGADPTRAATATAEASDRRRRGDRGGGDAIGGEATRSAPSPSLPLSPSPSLSLSLPLAVQTRGRRRSDNGGSVLTRNLQPKKKRERFQQNEREREREGSVFADMSVVAGAGLISLTNADMGVSVCERNGFWVHNCCHKSSLSSGFGFGFSIPPRPTFGVTLATKKLKQSWIFGLRTPSSSGRSIHVLLKAESTNRLVDGEIIKKELEFKPSFEDYLKAMESVRTGRDNKQTHNSIKRYKPTNADSSKLGDFQGHTQEEHASGQIDCKERGISKLKDANLAIGFEEKGNAGRVRDELDGRESKIDVNIDNKLDMDEKKWRSEKKRTNSISAQQRQRNSGVEGHRFKADKASLKGTKMGIGVERNFIQVEAVPHERISVNNVKFTRRNKPIAERSNDEQVELERAAFKSLEEFNDIVDKPRLSRNEMEERIQKLARCLNGADIDMPEWMFSKMMRSAKIRFSDHSMLRIIQILGKLGNWRRVLQLIEWLQLRDRFKSHKLRYIYTAALDALGKAKRPVEALNLFHAMQQHMSTYPDLVAYHFIAVTLGQAGHMKELFEVIDSMRSPPNKKFRTGVLDKWDPRLEPDIVVYNAVLNACVRRKQLEGAFWVLQQLKEQGQRPSSVTYGLVMEVMLACGKYNLVHDFFKKVLKSSIPNALTYKVLVNALWREGKTDEAILAVEDMERRGIVGSAALYYDLARCLCSAGRCQEGLTQIDKICKVANKPLVVTYTGLVQACLEAGNIQNGSYIFNHMHKFCSPNLVTCNIMLKAYLEHGMFEEAKGLFQKMLEDGSRVGNKVDYKERVMPDIYTFNTMLDACVTEQRWEDCEFVYKQMLHYGYHFNAKRHLRMVMDACRAGKVELLETTWKHLARADQTLPPLLMKEMFCMKLEQGDHAAALSSISSHHFSDSQVFSRKAWLNCFKENTHRFQKDSLMKLVREGNRLMSRSDDSSQQLICHNVITSCLEFLRTTHMTVFEMYDAQILNRLY